MLKSEAGGDISARDKEHVLQTEEAASDHANAISTLKQENADVMKVSRDNRDTLLSQASEAMSARDREHALQIENVASQHANALLLLKQARDKAHALQTKEAT